MKPSKLANKLQSLEGVIASQVGELNRLTNEGDKPVISADFLEHIQAEIGKMFEDDEDDQRPLLDNNDTDN